MTFDGEGVCGFENINLQAYLSKQKMFMHTTTVEKEIQTHSFQKKKRNVTGRNVIMLHTLLEKKKMPCS